MKVPDDLRYTKNHEWVRIEPGDVATIGITDFAQGELGDVVFVELEPVGSVVGRDEAFGTVEAVKTVSELFAPVSGTIEQVNEDLELSPDAVNSDPYGAGWMIRLKMDDPSEVDGLLTSPQYVETVTG